MPPKQKSIMPAASPDSGTVSQATSSFSAETSAESLFVMPGAQVLALADRLGPQATEALKKLSIVPQRNSLHEQIETLGAIPAWFRQAKADGRKVNSLNLKDCLEADPAVFLPLVKRRVQEVCANAIKEADFDPAVMLEWQKAMPLLHALEAAVVEGEGSFSQQCIEDAPNSVKQIAAGKFQTHLRALENAKEFEAALNARVKIKKDGGRLELVEAEVGSAAAALGLSGCTVNEYNLGYAGDGLEVGRKACLDNLSAIYYDPWGGGEPESDERLEAALVFFQKMVPPELSFSDGLMHFFMDEILFVSKRSGEPLIDCKHPGLLHDSAHQKTVLKDLIEHYGKMHTVELVLGWTKDGPDLWLQRFDGRLTLASSRLAQRGLWLSVEDLIHGYSGFKGFERSSSCVLFFLPNVGEDSVIPFEEKAAVFAEKAIIKLSLVRTLLGLETVKSALMPQVDAAGGIALVTRLASSTPTGMFEDPEDNLLVKLDLFIQILCDLAELDHKALQRLTIENLSMCSAQLATYAPPPSRHALAPHEVSGEDLSQSGGPLGSCAFSDGMFSLTAETPVKPESSVAFSDGAWSSSGEASANLTSLARPDGPDGQADSRYNSSAGFVLNELGRTSPRSEIGGSSFASLADEGLNQGASNALGTGRGDLAPASADPNGRRHLSPLKSARPNRGEEQRTLCERLGLPEDADLGNASNEFSGLRDLAMELELNFSEGEKGFSNKIEKSPPSEGAYRFDQSRLLNCLDDALAQDSRRESVNASASLAEKADRATDESLLRHTPGFR